jgi:ankyrin repeat protein
MALLPVRPDFDQLRHQAKDLLHAATDGDAEARQRVGDRLILASAQRAIAREYGFASWARLKVEVERRQVLNDRDLGRLRRMIAAEPDLATTDMVHWCDHKRAGPINYIAMLRFDAPRLGLPRDLPNTGAVAQLLIDAGAPVNGHPDDRETPLITAASYGDAEVAKVLVDNGADLEATAAPDAGGAPGYTALGHAAVFGMTDVVDVLVAAGARITSLELAAAAGDVSAWPLARSTLQSKLRALVFAADHQRLAAIDAILDAATPIDAEDAEWGRQPLRLAAQNGRVASVAHLLARGADPNVRDSDGRTALDWCQLSGADADDSTAHEQVAALLRPVTT